MIPTGCEPGRDMVGGLMPFAEEEVVLLVAVAVAAKPSGVDTMEAAVTHKAAEIDRRTVIMKGKVIIYM